MRSCRSANPTTTGSPDISERIVTRAQAKCLRPRCVSVKPWPETNGTGAALGQRCVCSMGWWWFSVRLCLSMNRSRVTRYTGNAIDTPI